MPLKHRVVGRVNDHSALHDVAQVGARYTIHAEQDGREAGISTELGTARKVLEVLGFWHGDGSAEDGLRCGLGQVIRRVDRAWCEKGWVTANGLSLRDAQIIDKRKTLCALTRCSTVEFGARMRS